MAINLTKIKDTAVLPELAAGDHLLVESGGLAKRIPASALKQPGLVFDTVADMETYIAAHADKLAVGMDLFIREEDAPDYWWDGEKAVEVETDLSVVKADIAGLQTSVEENSQAIETNNQEIGKISQEIAEYDKQSLYKADVERVNVYEIGENGVVDGGDIVQVQQNHPDYYKTSIYYRLTSGESIIVSSISNFKHYIVVDKIGGNVLEYCDENFGGNLPSTDSGRYFYKYTANQDCFIRFTVTTTGKPMLEFSQADTPSAYTDKTTLSDNVIVPVAETAKNANVAEVAETAIDAENAKVAKNAKTEGAIADYVVVNGFTTHSATIENVENNTVTVSSTVSYGAVGVKDDFDNAGRYLLVWTGDYIYKSAALNTAGWKYGEITSSVDINGETYHWTVFQFDDTCKTSALYLLTINNKTVTITIRKLLEISADLNVTDDYIKEIVGVTYNIAEEFEKISKKLDVDTWKDKNVLFIGDSLTAAKQYQNTVAEILGINIFNHCKGGMGIVNCVDGENGAGEYDNETAVEGTLYALKPDDVRDMDLIVFYAGYNNRGTTDGVVGDCYPAQGTIAGMMQYAINRIYEELAEANNLTCKIIIVTVDCAGKYAYINADGYEEWPPESGRTMETLSDVQKAVAEYNSLACLDLWHTSGINRNTWSVFGASADTVNTNYTVYELDASGNQVGTSPMKYVKGQSYYQIRDGAVVLEEYTGSAPYPYNKDQLHKSSEGYKRIGECIAGAIISAFGN